MDEELLPEGKEQPKYRRLLNGSFQCLRCGTVSESEEDAASGSCHNLADIYG